MTTHHLRSLTRALDTTVTFAEAAEVAVTSAARTAVDALRDAEDAALLPQVIDCGMMRAAARRAVLAAERAEQALLAAEEAAEVAASCARFARTEVARLVADLS
jgi:hypothetical protein